MDYIYHSFDIHVQNVLIRVDATVITNVACFNTLSVPAECGHRSEQLGLLDPTEEVSPPPFFHEGRPTLRNVVIFFKF
jgi:hypothetical protein